MLTFKPPSITSLRKRMILQQLSYTKEAWPIRPNYVPPRTRALTKRVGMDKRVPEPVVSPLQGEPHNEASLGQNDPDGVNGDINRQNWECDENSPTHR